MLSIVEHPSLAERTTLRIGGTALAEVTLTEAVDVFHLAEYCKRWGGEPFILGAGSNILAGPGEHPLVLVRPSFRHRPRIVEDDGESVLVRVGAGIRLPRLLGFCAAQGLSGLEGLCGIPGAVGGAIAMNAGSYGCETGERLESVRIFTPSLGVVDVGRESMVFSYRKFSISGISERFLVIQASFALTRSDRGGITRKMCYNFLKKKSTQPVRAWSAGCVFKNPSPQLPAGMLLEQAGFRGKRLGGMAFSEVHANFLINEGQGNAAVALELLAMAREAVRERFGILLEPEVRMLSCPSQ